MLRAKADMNIVDYARALEWVRYYEEKGQQKELALTGIGEALLHPDFIDMLFMARKVFKGFIHFSTNGILFDEEIAHYCNKLQIGVYVSMHRPEKAGPAIELAKQFGILSGTNSAFVDSALDWAGTVDWYVSAPKTVCRYQSDGWGVVMADGSITTCCMDSEGVNILGHVNDKIGSVMMEPKPMCANCHLELEKVA